MARYKGTTSKGFSFTYDTSPRLSDDAVVERAENWRKFALSWIDVAKKEGTLEDLKNVKDLTIKLSDAFIFGEFDFAIDDFNKKCEKMMDPKDPTKKIKYACYGLSSLLASYHQQKNNKNLSL